MNVSAFMPLGGTALIGTAATQVPISLANNVYGRVFRVRCLVAGYLTWGPTNAVVAAGAPTAGTPSPNTIGMSVVGGVEDFIFPGASWFISNVAASFEVTPGE